MAFLPILCPLKKEHSRKVPQSDAVNQNHMPNHVPTHAAPRAMIKSIIPPLSTHAAHVSSPKAVHARWTVEGRTPQRLLLAPLLPALPEKEILPAQIRHPKLNPLELRFSRDPKPRFPCPHRTGQGPSRPRQLPLQVELPIRGGPCLCKGRIPSSRQPRDLLPLTSLRRPKRELPAHLASQDLKIRDLSSLNPLPLLTPGHQIG